MATLDETPVLPPASPADDRTPPAFDGIQSVELIGDQIYRVRWEPGRDDVTRTPLLSYQVAHVTSAFGTPGADTRPVGVSLPGETSLELEVLAPAGRFFVRAVDQAGNVSPWGPALEQSARRPWLRVPDGSRPTAIGGCHATHPGQAICYGEDGYAARWLRDRWEPLVVGDGVHVRLAAYADQILLYGEQGHLYAFDEQGETRSLEISFDGEPSLPFRQFVVGASGLRYWLDAEGATWVSAGTNFRRMRRPIGIPGEDCATLRALQFSPMTGVAVCGNGAVFSVATERAGMRWLPLTADTPFDLPTGIEHVVADSDAEAYAVLPADIARVGVGGWTSLAEEAVPGRSLSMRRPLSWARTTWIPTSQGVFRIDDGRLQRVPGLEGDVAAVIAPSPLESQDSLTAVYANGGVLTWQRTRSTWRIPSAPTGFELAQTTAAGRIVALAEGEHRGVWLWRDAAWSRWSSALPSSDPDASYLAIAGRADPAWAIVAGSDATGPALWELRGGTWTRARWLTDPPPAAPPRGHPPDEPLPLQPLAGIPAERGLDPVLPDGPFVGVTIAEDGRAMAHTERQVWWRLADGWLPLATFDEPILAVHPDAGDSWVAIVGSLARRCWRHICDESVPRAGFEPDDVVAAWTTNEGLMALIADGALALFLPEPTPAREPRAPVPGPADVPAGSWADVAESLPPGSSDAVVQRLATPTFDVILRADGTIHEALPDGSFARQATAPDAIALVPWGDSWAVLTGRGMLRLGEVPVASRSPL